MLQHWGEKANGDDWEDVVNQDSKLLPKVGVSPFSKNL
jgi:hypothetical protein